MARVTNVFTAHFVGSAGFGTFKQLGGQTVFSQKSLGPTNERTPIQIGNERSMATLVAAGRPIKGAIDIGFNQLRIKNDPKKCRNTAWGAYIGENRKESNDVFDYTVPDNPTFLPENFITSKGTIAPTGVLTATADVSAQTVQVTYPATAIGVGQNLEDKPVLVVFNATSDQWAYPIDTGTSRQDGGATYSMAGTGLSFIISDDIKVYLAFQGYELAPSGATIVVTGKESDSNYFDATVQA